MPTETSNRAHRRPGTALTVGRPPRRTTVGLALATSAALLLTSCGGEAPAAPATATTSAAPAVTEPVDATTSTSASASPSTTTTSSTTGSPTEGGGVLTAGDEGRELTLADFFNPAQYWDEDRYDIADRKDVPGIATKVDSCYATAADELEMRLGNNFSQLTFSVGQANDSLSSDQSITVEVLGNESQREIQSVPFNEITEFDIPVEGVNALKIRLHLDDKVADCGGSVIGVLVDPVLS
ncbi:hypothetical protein [Blastococcus sp. SYSU DS0616]